MFGEDRLERIKKDLLSIQEDAIPTDTKKLVDPGCTLRTIQNFVEKLDKDWSSRLKEYIQLNKITVVNGKIFSCSISSSPRLIIDQVKLKIALGDDLSPYKSDSFVSSLLYKPRF